MFLLKKTQRIINNNIKFQLPKGQNTNRNPLRKEFKKVIQEPHLSGFIFTNKEENNMNFDTHNINKFPFINFIKDQNNQMETDCNLDKLIMNKMNPESLFFTKKQKRDSGEGISINKISDIENSNLENLEKNKPRIQFQNRVLSQKIRPDTSFEKCYWGSTNKNNTGIKNERKNNFQNNFTIQLFNSIKNKNRIHMKNKCKELRKTIYKFAENDLLKISKAKNIDQLLMINSKKDPSSLAFKFLQNRKDIYTSPKPLKIEKAKNFKFPTKRQNLETQNFLGSMLNSEKNSYSNFLKYTNQTPQRIFESKQKELPLRNYKKNLEENCMMLKSNYYNPNDPEIKLFDDIINKRMSSNLIFNNNNHYKLDKNSPVLNLLEGKSNIRNDTIKAHLIKDSLERNDKDKDKKSIQEEENIEEKQNHKIPQKRATADKELVYLQSNIPIDDRKIVLSSENNLQCIILNDEIITQEKKNRSNSPKTSININLPGSSDNKNKNNNLTLNSNSKQLDFCLNINENSIGSKLNFSNNINFHSIAEENIEEEKFAKYQKSNEKVISKVEQITNNVQINNKGEKDEKVEKESSIQSHKKSTDGQSVQCSSTFKNKIKFCILKPHRICVIEVLPENQSRTQRKLPSNKKLDIKNSPNKFDIEDNKKKYVKYLDILKE